MKLTFKDVERTIIMNRSNFGKKSITLFRRNDCFEAYGITDAHNLAEACGLMDRYRADEDMSAICSFPIEELEKYEKILDKKKYKVSIHMLYVNNITQYRNISICRNTLDNIVRTLWNRGDKGLAEAAYMEGYEVDEETAKREIERLVFPVKIVERESGKEIDVCTSWTKAEDEVWRYEQEDKQNGSYTKNYYEIRANI